MDNPVTTTPESDVKMWNMLCHLTGVVGFLGPLIVWLIKKNEIPTVDVHGKEALNFQLTVIIILVSLSVVASILTFILIGFLLYPVIGLLWLGAIALSIYAGIQANNGVEFKYPLNFNLIK